MARVDVVELRDKVKVMYRAVADAPKGEFHFGRGSEGPGFGPGRGEDEATQS